MHTTKQDTQQKKHLYTLRIGHKGESRSVGRWPRISAQDHDVDFSSPEKAEKYARETLSSDTSIEKIIIRGKGYNKIIDRS